MARILSLSTVDRYYYLIKVEAEERALPGQFYMLFSPNRAHLLGRPVSVFKTEPGAVEFLIKRVGEGTREIEGLGVGDDLVIHGPFGNRFPKLSGKKIACIGGGVGIAPFYEVVRESGGDNDFTLYLGLAPDGEGEKVFSDLSCTKVVKKGGYITDGIPYGDFDVIFTCGPMIMMEKVVKGAEAENKPVYVSLEARMGCGFGACLGCSVETKENNQRVCKEGPVFPGEVVFYA